MDETKEYLPGFINNAGEFQRKVGDYYYYREDAVVAARDYVEEGLALFVKWGLDITLKPAIQTRYTHYSYDPAELV